MIFFATSSAANTWPPPTALPPIAGTLTTTANGFFSATIERIGALRRFVGTGRVHDLVLELAAPVL